VRCMFSGKINIETFFLCPFGRGASSYIAMLSIAGFLGLSPQLLFNLLFELQTCTMFMPDDLKRPF